MPETPSPTSWVGEAFGLLLRADFPLPGLRKGQAGKDGRETELRAASGEEIGSEWRGESTERLLERQHADGSVGMTVDSHPEHGYLVDAPGYGRFLVRADGSRIDCAMAAGPAWCGYRPLFAQALPLAASLQGLELLHASAVLAEEGALAFTGHSGAGKTSLAVHMVNHGTELLTDDVLALSVEAGSLAAHPGVRFANIDREQFAATGGKGRPRLGRVIGESDKLHIAVERFAATPARLAGLYFVQRGPSAAELAFEPVQPPDPVWLLASTFMPHLSTPVRMTSQLEVCALIAAEVPTFRLRIPEDVPAPRVAEAVERHRRELLILP